MNARRLLVVDDERVARESLAAWLHEDGHTVDMASGSAEAVERARSHEYALCFIDLRMPPGPDGIETLKRIREIRPDAICVIMTAFAAVDTAVEAMKHGAEDYLVKPINPQEISLLAERLLRMRQIRRENIVLRKKLQRQYSLHDIIAKSAKMQAIIALVREVASLRSTVLIEGESGTGKEVVARALHSAGERRDRPFVAVSCAALPESLLESELFGYEKGAFTGAQTRRRGKFEMADTGTLFLDEIGDISPRLQADLLRVLQERAFFRVGGNEEIAVDVRIVAATNRDLQAAVGAGEFRDDLFYRLNVITIRVPPLRERMEDVPLLAEHFVERLATELKKDVVGISAGGLRVLLAYDWPGNTRELENTIERALVTCRGRELTEEDLAFLRDMSAERQQWRVPDDRSLTDIERQVIAAVLRRTGGHVKEAAAVLGIDRSTLYEKMKRYEITR